MIIKQTDLQFTEGTSDKVYMVALHQYDDGSQCIICHYGRRGSTLKQVDKGTFYNFPEAYSNYCKIIEQKKSKGYWVIGTFDHETGSSKKPEFPSVPSLAVEKVEKPVEPVIESWTSTEDEREKALKRLRESCAVW